ncbi:hypothetical protein HETIRDRAFT_424613 [Heterobasidion irregulare TC 32-1]|uniref:Uncharacterized protein n=1 Tax=Heterobasidion irregulare (strain TC 32-1) TaxID=747525 RepID=W4KHC4_HETIT|nr:uncharacterized protein HETIRDRAFT_424613 [Heterobasidion irregulare TC 32-1]ETW85237.1 hypothetical protein HETIRDRAFT_424613 [Heterobasidion irregulare TC 32-1]
MSGFCLACLGCGLLAFCCLLWSFYVPWSLFLSPCSSIFSGLLSYSAALVYLGDGLGRAPPHTYFKLQEIGSVRGRQSPILSRPHVLHSQCADIMPLQLFSLAYIYLWSHLLQDLDQWKALRLQATTPTSLAQDDPARDGVVNEGMSIVLYLSKDILVLSPGPRLTSLAGLALLFFVASLLHAPEEGEHSSIRDIATCAVQSKAALTASASTSKAITGRHSSGANFNLSSYIHLRPQGFKSSDVFFIAQNNP